MTLFLQPIKLKYLEFIKIFNNRFTKSEKFLIFSGIFSSYFCFNYIYLFNQFYKPKQKDYPNIGITFGFSFLHNFIISPFFFIDYFFDIFMEIICFHLDFNILKKMEEIKTKKKEIFNLQTKRKAIEEKIEKEISNLEKEIETKKKEIETKRKEIMEEREKKRQEIFNLEQEIDKKEQEVINKDKKKINYQKVFDFFNPLIKNIICIYIFIYLTKKINNIFICLIFFYFYILMFYNLIILIYIISYFTCKKDDLICFYDTRFVEHSHLLPILLEFYDAIFPGNEKIFKTKIDKKYNNTKNNLENQEPFKKIFKEHFDDDPLRESAILASKNELEKREMIQKELEKLKHGTRNSTNQCFFFHKKKE